MDAPKIAAPYSTPTDSTNGDAPLARPRRRFTWTWLGVAPFFLFAILFLFLPSVSIFIRSFEKLGGGYTLQNFVDIFTKNDIRNAYAMSLKISTVTALGGALFGFLLAYAVCLGGLPRWARSFLISFSGVASNFAGVPLAFAFVATMGNAGLMTRIIESVLKIDIHAQGVTIYNFWGLSIVYMYFQFPLMVLIMAPALDGLRREWREACENLGGSNYDYWRHVALPILMPTLLGTTILLFGNAFGAYATAYAFTGSFLNLVTIVIGAQIQGDVLYNPGLGN
ncbi:MAG TPA: ABC transporter permease subunit, partial [Anaerolineales bacterium]|nr:ABC transporter permease subunit [Anaerolineales bacterium]